MIQAITGKTNLSFNLPLGTSDLLQLLGSTENTIQLWKMSKSPNCLRHNHMKDLPTGIATSFCVCCKLCSFVIRIKVDLFKQILYMIQKDLYRCMKISISNKKCICYLWKCASLKRLYIVISFFVSRTHGMNKRGGGWSSTAKNLSFIGGS